MFPFANQCVNFDSVTVNVLALPIADAGPDLWICPGGSMQLNATGGLGYVWFPDSTLNDGFIQTPVANPADLLPSDSNSSWASMNPVGDLKNVNL